MCDEWRFKEIEDKLIRECLNLSGGTVQENIGISEWINVNEDLPENGKQVLTLLEGYFGCIDSTLCQKRSYRVFQSTFHRYKGWDTPFCPEGCWVKYWMDKPDDPDAFLSKNNA